MKQLWNSFKIAFSMYSRIPVPKSEWTKEYMKYTLCFFPAVGGIVGLLVICWSDFSSFLNLGILARTAGLARSRSLSPEASTWMDSWIPQTL